MKKAVYFVRQHVALTLTTGQDKNMAKKQEFDLYTFVAGKAIEGGDPFPLQCNCGATVTIMPPFQEDSVICPACECSIRILVVEGDPGYIIGRDSDGQPRLLPVQGSSAKPPELLSEPEREDILKKVQEQIKLHQKKHGKPK